MKTCRSCGERKPFVGFYPSKLGSNGLRSKCNLCEAAKNKENPAMQREYSKRFREKKRLTDPKYRSTQHLARRYGLTPVDWDALFNAQGRSCAICKTTTGQFHTDHDHVSGAVRGVLCAQCNHMLGNAKDSVAVLAGAIAYLQNERKSA